MNTPKNTMNKPKRAYRVTPKPIHYKLVKSLVENNGHKAKAMTSVGYSEITAQNPKQIMESKGFIQALHESGLDIDTLNHYLASDLKAKKANRLGELTLAYKLHGKLRENVSENKTLILITSGESANRYKALDTPHSQDSV